MIPWLLVLGLLARPSAPPPRPCTPLVRGARVVACAPATPSFPTDGARLDSPQGGVLTSRPSRPAPSRESEEEEHEAPHGSGASSR